MSHPAIVNRTRLALAPLFVGDEDGYPSLVLVVKGTFTIPESDVQLVLAREQVPVLLEGEFWGEPDTSSYRLEPEIAPFKPGTDVVLLGHTFPENEKQTELEVGFRCGPVQQLARVVGDRTWIKKLGRIRPSDPAPVGRLPLQAERAFGGWDRSAEDPKKHRMEMRNPVGVGYHVSRSSFVEGLPVPNLEEPGAPVKSFTGSLRPALFGFTSPGWEPRIRHAGTYDKKWEKQRKPLLPADFDPRFYNAAPPGLIAPGRLRGDEAVTVIQAGRRARTNFYLPGIHPPRARGVLRSDEDFELQTELDTVIVDADADRVHLLWRARLRLRSGPEDLAEMEIISDDRRLEASSP